MATINSLIEKINSGNNPLFQELYGTDTSVLKEQADRYSKLLNEFKNKFNNDGVELFSSPGRTEIGGNHTDHNYGRVLAGIQVPDREMSNFMKDLRKIGYRFWDETANPAYELFLAD